MAFFNFFLLALIVYTLLKWIWRGGKAKPQEPQVRRKEQEIEEMKQDPVCGTYVPASLAVTACRDNETVYFCSGACRDKFLQPPPTR
ncbi:MAG: transcriptional regulator [Candidatus Aminicenantes bacterium]|nr:transcriptional regulator [Candidatus Aminicenantes bacterium]